MLAVYYKPTFVRHAKRLEDGLFREMLEKIELFKDEKNHKKLEVHKLKGRLKNFYAFSINYKARIIFEYTSEKEVVLLEIDPDHKYDYKQ